MPSLFTVLILSFFVTAAKGGKGLGVRIYSDRARSKHADYNKHNLLQSASHQTESREIASVPRYKVARAYPGGGKARLHKQSLSFPRFSPGANNDRGSKRV